MINSLPIFNSLPFSTQMKTKEIFDLKDEISKLKVRCSFWGIAFLICLIMCLSIMNDFINSFPRYTLSQFDLYILIATFTSYILFDHFVKKHNKKKSRYTQLRLDIINTIGNDFCIHSHSCDCRDLYVIQMHERGIDVIFK